jgi:hypothetical protein
MTVFAPVTTTHHRTAHTTEQNGTEQIGSPAVLEGNITYWTVQ